MKTLRIGSHINISHGLVSSADYANKLGANFYQIFLASPQQYNGPRRPHHELLKLKKKLDKLDIKIIIHANFMLNFCNPVNDYKHTSAVTLLEKDLRDCSTLGAIGVVIHMGKCLKYDEEVALQNYVKGVQSALKSTPKDSVIILETGAGQGTELCTDIINLGQLYRRFSKTERERIKFCIDTCHVYAAGYDLGCEDYVDMFCDLISTHLSWKNVVCIHLNDSKQPLNCRKDRHADITEGCIEKDGLRKFVKFCYSKSVPIVLETPCDTSLSSADQIKLVKSWVYD